MWEGFRLEHIFILPWWKEQQHKIWFAMTEDFCTIFLSLLRVFFVYLLVLTCFSSTSQENLMTTLAK
jgi:NADH:ubiquinone oxidoreductase subunit 3 (subunit A)